MIWTRRFFNQFEWFHKAISPIEESFMLPLQLNESINLISKRLNFLFPKNTWKVINGYLYFRGDYLKMMLQINTLFLPYRFFKELKISNKRWEEKILPEYESKIKFYKNRSVDKLTIKTQIELLEEIARNEAWFFSESIYVALYCGFTELLLNVLFNLIVKESSMYSYYFLLSGYPDKSIIMDHELWLISQLENNKQLDAINEWVIKYGYRIQDKDIIFPTLGENKELIKSYIKLYKDITDPLILQKKTALRRLECEKYLKNNLRNLPYLSNLFLKVVKTAQDYARIRNSRPFYYQGNSLMRVILLNIAKESNLFADLNDIFYLKIEEIEESISVKAENERILKLVNYRKTLYARQTKRQPAFSVIQ